MAQAAYRNSVYTGAAAYDLYGSAAPQRQQLPQDLPRSGARQQPRRENHLLTALSCVAAAVIMVLVLFAHQRLYAATYEVKQLQNRLAEVQEEHIQLRSQYDRSVDLTLIEAEATTRLGMSRPAAGQTVYITLPGTDRGEVLGKSSDSVFAELGDFVTDAFANLGAYLSWN